MLKRYLNIKVLAVAAAVGIGVIVIYPELLRYWPLLLVAACPLSMLLMGHGGHGGHAGHAGPTGLSAAGAGQYACPMHSDFRSDAPGRCPRCGMALVPETSGINSFRPQPRKLSR
jgi:hypothetical protein